MDTRNNTRTRTQTGPGKIAQLPNFPASYFSARTSSVNKSEILPEDTRQLPRLTYILHLVVNRNLFTTFQMTIETSLTKKGLCCRLEFYDSFYDGTWKELVQIVTSVKAFFSVNEVVSIHETLQFCNYLCVIQKSLSTHHVRFSKPKSGTLVKAKGGVVLLIFNYI